VVGHRVNHLLRNLLHLRIFGRPRNEFGAEFVLKGEN
jgi:hypothetical protein